MIGDSLTVGPFGERVESWLLKGGGPEKIAVYGSCGSSPEHWLAAEKVFTTPCGYRETHGRTRILETHRDGHPPRPTPTPKIENLLALHHPDLIIVQLGTNHYSNLEDDGMDILPKLAARYDAFADALVRHGRNVKRVVWITPPDSSRYSSTIESEVSKLILSTAARHRFRVIDSQKLTRYVKGKTGSDGIHYGKDAAYAWADAVIRQLNVSLAR